MTDTAFFWNKIARKYAARPIADMDAYLTTLDRAAYYLHRDDDVLELGCGTGTTATKLAPFVHHYTATDLAPEMVEIGREKVWDQSIRNISMMVAEPGSDALQGRSFDAVLGFNLFHLVPDPQAALAHVYRLTKPGGHFISKTPCLGGLGPKTGMIRAVVFGMRLLRKAPAVTFLNAADWADMIRAAGFEIVERGTYPEGGMNRFIVARRPE